MAETLISVIIPVRNVEAYLTQCIKSITEQTYRHFEVILINDGSNDRSGELCDRFAKEDSRIKVIHNDVNQGVSNARNQGLALASGEWIAFVDADDWLDKNAFYALMDGCGADQDCIFFGFSKDYEDGTCKKIVETTLPLIAKQPFNIQYTLKQTYIKEEQDHNETDYVFSGIWRVLFKKSIIERNGLFFDKELRYSEDKLFLVQYLSLCKVGRLVEGYFYHYRQNNPQSATATILNNTLELSWLETFLPKICDAITKNAFISDKEKEDLIFYMRDRFVYRALMGWQDDKKRWKEFLRNDLVKGVVKSWNKKALISSKLNKRDVMIRMIIKYKLFGFWRLCVQLKKKI